MPFTVQHTPLSALLGLGSITGQGIGIARQKAENLQRLQVLSQIAAQQNADLIRQQESQNQLQAQSEANRIQQSLASARLQQEQQQAEQAQKQREIENAARQQLSLQQQQQANERQNTQEQQQQLAQQKFETTQRQLTEKDVAVESMIDRLYPPGSPENLHLKLQYRASGRIPAPQSESQARNLNALVLARKTLVDPIGEALPGKEEQLKAIDSQIAALIGNIGQVAAPAPSQGQPVRVNTKAERDALPPGTMYVGPDGVPAIKQ